MLVKGVYDLTQSLRAWMELNQFLSENFGSALIGTPGNILALDRPISREVLRQISQLPDEKKNRIRKLIASMMKKASSSVISFINAFPDEVVSGGIAATLSVASFDEMLLSLSQLSGEVLGLMSDVAGFFEKDQLSSRLIYSFFNRRFMTNVGLVATAVGLLDPTKTESLIDELKDDDKKKDRRRNESRSRAGSKLVSNHFQRSRII